MEKSDAIFNCCSAEMIERPTEMVEMVGRPKEIVDVFGRQTDIVGRPTKIVDMVNMFGQPTEMVDVVERTTEMVDVVERPTEMVDMVQRPTEMVDVVQRPTEMVDVVERHTEMQLHNCTSSTIGKDDEDLNNTENNRAETDDVFSANVSDQVGRPMQNFFPSHTQSQLFHDDNISNKDEKMNQQTPKLYREELSGNQPAETVEEGGIGKGKSEGQEEVTGTLALTELKEYAIANQEIENTPLRTLALTELKEYAIANQEIENTPLSDFSRWQSSAYPLAMCQLSQDDTQDASAQLDARISDSQDLHESVCIEIIQKRVRLVKSYAWIKEEMEPSTAKGVADRLFAHQPILLSRRGLESIHQAIHRRDAVELLLKKVLMGPDGIHEVFLDALGKEGGEGIVEQLENVQITETDIEVFIALERSAEHGDPRPSCDEPRLVFTKRNKHTLEYWLNEKDVVDSINDHFLSRFIFQIDEHTDIADNSMDTKAKLKRLIEKMQSCSENILKDFFEILALDAVNMSDIIPKLEKENIGGVITRQKQKRKSSSDIEDIIQPTPMKRQRVQKALSESKESRIVQAIQRRGSNVINGARELGLEVDAVKKGSIIIQLTPKDSDSWQKLKSRCRDGKIKDFIPEVFRNNEAEMEEGEYIFQFTIYLLPTPPFSPADKKVMFHLETKQPISIDIEENSRLLCQELEITNDLLAKLKKEKIVDENIKQNIDKNRTRRGKIKYLLDEIASHGERGYNILKEYIRNANVYLYRKLVVRDAMKKINASLPEATNVTHKQASREITKEVFYSAELVLLVEKKEIKEKEGKRRTNVEITCPTILESECFFSDEAEKYQGDSEEEFFSLEDNFVRAAEQEKRAEPDACLDGKRKSTASYYALDVSQECPGKRVNNRAVDDDSKERERASEETVGKDNTLKGLDESEATPKRDKDSCLL